MIINRKFGVTFHDNMDLPTILNQWGKVAPSIQAANPTIAAAMLAGSVALGIQQTGVGLEATARSAFKTIQEAVEAASAILVGNGAYVGGKVAAIAAGGVQELASNVIESQQSSLFELINNT